MNKISYDPKNWDEVCRLLGAYMDTCLTPEEIEKQKDEVEFLFCSLENCWKVTNELRRSWNCKSKEARAEEKAIELEEWIAFFQE